MSTNHKRWKDMLVGGVITVAAVALVGTAVAAIGPKINNISAAPTSTGSGISTLSAGASTASTSYIGEERAKEIALNHAGLTASGVTFVRSYLDWDDGRAQYEVEFYANNTEYDYDIDAITGDIRSYDYDAEYYAPPATSQGGTTTTTGTTATAAASTGNPTTATASTGSTNYIGEERAKEIALNHAGLTASGVTFVRSHLDWDDGRAQYEVEFYANNTEYDYDIDATTGDIRSYDYDAEYYTPSTTAANTSSTSYIGEERAKEIALDHAGLTASGVTFVRSHLDWDDGRAQYEVEFYANNTEYDYDIDATTGDIRSYDYDAEYYTPPATSQSGDTISESQVKEIVQSRSGTYDGTFSRINLDWDDGRMVYEGEYYSGWTEYEFEIDAYSGTILGWDWD